jgi:hypothetical protein
VGRSRWTSDGLEAAIAATLYPGEIVCDAVEAGRADEVEDAFRGLPDGVSVLAWMDALAEARRREDPDLIRAVNELDR